LEQADLTREAMMQKGWIRNILPGLALCGIVTACAVPSVPVDITIPSLTIQPLPLRVALIAPSDVTNARIDEKDWCVGRISASYGGEFTKEFGDALGKAFDKVEVVTKRPADPSQYDLLIETYPPGLKVETHCKNTTTLSFALSLVGVAIIAATRMENDVDAQASLHTIVLDANGQTLTTDDFRSSKVERSYPAIGSTAPQVIGQTIAETLSEVVRETVYRLAESPKVRDYATVATARRNGQQSIDTSAKKDP
jgi:hypothetical protein